MCYTFKMLSKANTEEKILYNFTCIRLLEEKAMATHSSTLAWQIPWMEEPLSFTSSYLTIEYSMLDCSKVTQIQYVPN